jgi:hypothetical protein
MYALIDQLGNSVVSHWPLGQMTERLARRALSNAATFGLSPLDVRVTSSRGHAAPEIAGAIVRVATRSPIRETISNPIIKSMTSTHPGKITPAVVKCRNVNSVIPQFMNPMKKTLGDSVEGANHDLRRVGRAAT